MVMPKPIVRSFKNYDKLFEKSREGACEMKNDEQPGLEAPHFINISKQECMARCFK